MRRFDDIISQNPKAANQSQRVSDGADLELLICKQLIKLMSGEMGIECNSSSGALLWIEFVLPVCHQNEGTVSADFSFGGQRVVVANHNPNLCNVLAEQFQTWNINSTMCLSGTEALRLLEETSKQGIKIDAVVADYRMAGLNGQALIDKMQKDSRLATIPVVMLFSEDEIKDHNLLSSLRVAAKITKPVRLSVLKQCLKSVLVNQDDKMDHPDVCSSK